MNNATDWWDGFFVAFTFTMLGITLGTLLQYYFIVVPLQVQLQAKIDERND